VRCFSVRRFILRRINNQAMRPAKSINAAIMPPTMPPTESLNVDELTSELAVGEDRERTDEVEDAEAMESGPSSVPEGGGRVEFELGLLEPYTMESKVKEVWSSVDDMSNV